MKDVSRPNCDFKDGVCIHTDQVYDSCREKDCLEDLQVILTAEGQAIVDRAINVKIKSAEVIWVFTDLESVPFNKGFYTVDIKYFFRVILDVFCGVGQPTQVEGLATYDKKVILFGSEGNSKTFTSSYNPGNQMCDMWKKNNLPRAIVEVVDPIALSARIVDASDKCCCCNCCDVSSIPDSICGCFRETLVVPSNERKILVTLGIFTIVKIERNVQLLIPAIDFCIPTKECTTATEQNPCELFNTLRFPMDEFFPPQRGEFTDGCGC